MDWTAIIVAILARLCRMDKRLDVIEARCANLADRMAVNEEHVIGHENRLQDLEEQYDDE